MQSLVDSFGDIPDTKSTHWMTYITETRELIDDLVSCEGLCHLEECYYAVYDETEKKCHLGYIDHSQNASQINQGTFIVRANVPILNANSYRQQNFSGFATNM